MKKTLKILAIALASLAGLFVVASAAVYFLVDLDALIADKVAEYQPRIESELGRKVEIGPIHARFFPTLGARIEGVSIAAAEGAQDQASLLRIDAAGFDLDLLQALLSFGKRIGISAIYVDGLKVRVERGADGRLSFQDILDHRAAAEAGKPPAADEGLSPAVLELLQGISISEIRLAGGSIELVDRQTATAEVATSTIRELNLRLRDVRLSDPLRIELSAAVFDPGKNLELQVKVGPLPADLDFAKPFPIRDLHARIDAIDLAPLTPYLGTALPARLDAARISASYDIPELIDGRPLDVNGYFAVAPLKFEEGEAFDLRLDSKVHADLRTLSARIDELRLRAGEIEVAMEGSVQNLATAPAFEGFKVRSTTLDPARILAFYPPLRSSLPAGSHVAGPITIDLAASGTEARQQLQGLIDLGKVNLLVPGALAKPAATPLSLRLDAELGKSDADLKSATFTVGELALQLAGTVKDFDAPAYDFTLSAPPFNFDSLVRLAPSVKEQLLEAGASASGQGSISGKLQGAPGKVDGKLSLALLGASLDVPKAKVHGDVRLEVQAQGNPTGDLQLGLLLDAGTSVIQVEELMNKGAGTPLVVDIAAVRHGESFRFDRFDVRLAELAMKATGSLAASGTSELKVHLEPVDLEKLAATFPMIPAERVKAGSLQADLAVSGDPGRLETVNVGLTRFELRLGRSDLSAQGTVRNLEAPQVSASLRSSLLDLDSLLPASEAPKEEKPKAEDDPSLKRFGFDGSFDIQRAIVSGRELQNLKGRVKLRDGVFTIEEGGFNLYGGTFRAGGTEAEIWRGQIPFHARFEGEGVDVAKLLVAETGRASPISGKARLSIDFQGKGVEKEELEKNLSGSWNIALPDGKVSGLGITHAVLGDFSALPGFAQSRLSREESLRDLFAGFAVQNGRMELQKPLAVVLDGNPLVLEGAVGIFGELFLEGKYTVAARRIDQLTGGKCHAEKDPVVPLRITGPASSPDVRPDAGNLALTLAKACLAGKAGEVVDELLGKGAAAKATEAADDLKEAAQVKADEAKAALDAEKAKAKAEADRLKAEAEQKRKAAEDAAAKKAKEAAGGLKKKLGF